MRKIIVKIRDYLLRKVKYRKYDIGKNFHSGKGVNIWAKKEISIGKNFYIGRFSQIECDTIIGDNVIIGNYVAFVLLKLEIRIIIGKVWTQKLLLAMMFGLVMAL